MFCPVSDKLLTKRFSLHNIVNVPELVIVGFFLMLKGKGVYMTKVFNFKLAVLFLSMVLLQSCAATKEPKAPSPAAQEKSAPKTSFESSTVIAKIGDYAITNGDLMARLISEITPQPDYFGEGKIYQPTDTRTILMKMIAEKAMLIEARELNYQDDEEIQDPIKIFRDEKLSSLLLESYLRDKMKVTDEEIDRKIKTDPNLDRNQAKQMLERARVKELTEQFYAELYKKHHFQKVSDNFPEAARIYQRLQAEAAKNYDGGNFVRVRQVRQLPPQEKNLVLMTYDNGKVTLKEFLMALCELSPPSRPASLSTPAGIDSFLSEEFKTPVFIAEACARGLDKNKDLLNQIKGRENIYLFNKVIVKKSKGVPEPKDPYEITGYYEKHKKEYGTPDMLRIDQIWCEDLETARKAKADLSSGTDFDAVKEEYSLEKTSNPVDVYPGTEGMFFSHLWKGEPNQIGGPLKGFYKEMLKWRVVKILRKQPGRPKGYDNSMRKDVKTKLWAEQREAALEKYRQELLKKYQYQIYDDKIRDPLNMP